MMIIYKIPIWCALAFGLLTACASTAGRDDFSEVQGSVRERLGAEVVWNTNSEDDQLIENRVDALLAKPLNINAALQVALLYNPGLQASYEEIGVAQAELVQAGLLQNPVFTADAGFGGGASRLQFGVVANFLDLFLRPARKRMAVGELDAVRFRVTAELHRFARDFKIAYYRWQSNKQVLEMRRLQFAAAEAALAFARRLHAAGNISDLDLALEREAHSMARLAVHQSETEAAADRETLIRLMGLAGPRVATWSATDELQTAPATTPIDLAGLAERALGQRLDLAAARRDLESIDAALEFSQSSPFYIFEAGLSVERDTDRLTLVGPQISIDLPFFDRRQAQIQKLEAMRRQLLQRERNLSNEIRSEVRDASLALTAARDRAEVYRTGVIPERERVVELLQERYNAMLAGVFDLLRAKQNETAAYSEYLETLRDYWIAVARLEYQLGGPLTGEPGALDQSVQTQEK